MSAQEGNRDNKYSFDDFLFVRDNFNYYTDDEFFQALVRKYSGDEFDEVDRDLRALSDYVSFRFRDLANSANQLENRIKCTRVKHFDAYNHRIDRIERCLETEILEREIFSLGLYDPARNTPWSRFIKMFLLYQNGEAGVMCPVACTHGAVEIMQKFEDVLEPEARRLLEDLRDGENGEYKLGAQFVSEIQGGSDIPSNLVEAVFEKEIGSDGYSNCWRLYGQKYFCSAMQADCAIVTAKPKGVSSSTKVAVFVVPSWLPGNKEREIRNSFTIDRLKEKMGTAELPTAEITYNGSVAYPVGPLENGLANIVGTVLSLSRLHCAFGMAAGGLRVAREATMYSQFRTAFGVPISSFPLMMNQIDDLEHFAKRSSAGVFKVYSEFINFGEELISGIRDLEKIDDLNTRRRRFRLRELVMLQKIVVVDETPAMIRKAISFFGGHGIMEDFLSFPRLHRDSLIMELWEGPRNTLLAQIHRDFQRVKEWYGAEAFVRDLLKGSDSDLIENYALKFSRIISHESLLTNNEETLKVCRDWEEFSNELFIAYQELALKELDFKGEPLKFPVLLTKFRKREK
ncbi:MAG: acyl-CoA dehydrogenase family protein [Promethearchaeota archaeon]|jgi:alkylation response protein AidB-like acyl-CoA dehydrogenase